MIKRLLKKVKKKSKIMKTYFTKSDEELKWKEEKCTNLLNTAVFEVTQRSNKAHNGTEGKYIVLNAKDWVIVIPSIKDDFLMVKQWRHGEKKLSIEFPGGVIDEGEDPEHAAYRELKEETGYCANNLIKLGSFNPNPALFSNHVHIFYSDSLSKTDAQKLDADEFINCITISHKEVLNGMGTEEFPHALIGTALTLYYKYLASR